MDEMSDADRKSEPDVEDEMGMENEEGFNPGNDTGATNGLDGGRNIGRDRQDDFVEAEEVPRWGVVLVQGDKLEGERHSNGSRTKADGRKERVIRSIKS